VTGRFLLADDAIASECHWYNSLLLSRLHVPMADCRIVRVDVRSGGLLIQRKWSTGTTPVSVLHGADSVFTTSQTTAAVMSTLVVARIGNM
jgi:hypothetical protein